MSDEKIKIGADFSEKIEIKNPDGTPLDLTGCTVKSQIRKCADSGSTLIAEFDISIEHQNGVVYRKLPYSKTSLLTDAFGYTDLLFIMSDGKRFYTEPVKISIERTVTTDEEAEPET